MLNIAVDGTSASGKSSVSQEVAKKLNILHLNTGAFYRACALFCINQGLDPTNEKDVQTIVENAKIEVAFENGQQITLLNNVNINDDILSSNVSEVSSILSQKLAIRNKVRLIQKDVAKNNDVLMEGRDIGTEILPNAKYKFFITASLEERARRRFEQLKAKDAEANFNAILQALKERDIKDQTRELSPLKMADDAILIDTTELNFNQVVEKILSYIKE